MLLILLGAFALFGHEWLAATAGKTVAAVVGIALIVLAGIGIRDDVRDLARAFVASVGQQQVSHFCGNHRQVRGTSSRFPFNYRQKISRQCCPYRR